jgi:hypothetical protein
MNHHMQGDIPSRTGDPITVKGKQMIVAIDLLELFLERSQTLPMSAAAIAIQKSSLCQNISARA